MRNNFGFLFHFFPFRVNCKYKSMRSILPLFLKFYIDLNLWQFKRSQSIDRFESFVVMRKKKFLLANLERSKKKKF